MTEWYYWPRLLATDRSCASIDFSLVSYLLCIGGFALAAPWLAKLMEWNDYSVGESVIPLCEVAIAPPLVP